MHIPTDIEIAQSATLEPIAAIAKRAQIDETYLTPYGGNKA